MREIKYRAWLKNDKKMLSVGGIDFYYRKVIDLSYAQLGNLAARYPFDDVELMQYTGLHDKNGKEIYEGDIVQYDNGAEYEVLYDDETCLFCLKNSSDIHSLIIDDTDELEVVGNIYETK